ncbi:MAG: c-type cytochrome biogenesis protein CcmI [Acidisphaera sp.]|nr:c-type cytochrome biogenesis protein CcmI [Acidisphaera sp.]
MIWLALALMAAAAMAPLAWTLLRAPPLRDRREAALALHRAQLTELERDRAEGRIGAAEHATAVLEVQRRALAEAAIPESTPRRAARAPLLVVLVLVPLAGLALYLPGASPEMPAAPLAARVAATEEADALVAELRSHIAALDPKSPKAREGFLLLGNVEDARGNLPAAAAAWRKALDAGFDPTLAARVAEAMTRVQGRVTPEAAALFREALAQAPPDAPWRHIAEQRLAGAK